MPIDCLPVEERYCIPVEYAEVIEPGGIFRSVDKQGRPIEVDPAAVRRLGVLINQRQTDVFAPTPVAGMATRSFGQATLYYAYSCTGLNCMMRMVWVTEGRRIRAERCGTFVSEFLVAGTSPEGLRRAVASIRLRVPDRPAGEWPTLASFAPHIQPPVKSAPDCFPRRPSTAGEGQ